MLYLHCLAKCGHCDYPIPPPPHVSEVQLQQLLTNLLSDDRYLLFSACDPGLRKLILCHLLAYTNYAI